MSTYQPGEAGAALGGIPTWQQVLADATTTAQVVALANEYISRLHPTDVEALPRDCKPRLLSTSVDVNAYAIDLMRARYGDARAGEVVHRVSVFFQEAAQRLAHLSGPAKDLPQSLWTTHRGK